MSRAKKLRIAWLIWAAALLTNSTLWFVSFLDNYTYAGPLGFIAITDGYIALPFTFEKTWGDWGWFSQEPWYTDTGHSNDYPWPINYDKRYYHVHAPALVVRFDFINLVLFFFIIRRLYRILRRSISFSLLAVTLTFAFLYLPFFLSSHGPMFSFYALRTIDNVILTPSVGSFALWIILQICTLLALLDAIKYYRRKRLLNSGLCPICRYNLTGNTSGVCPECGSVTPTEPIRTADV